MVVGRLRHRNHRAADRRRRPSAACGRDARVSCHHRRHNRVADSRSERTRTGARAFDGGRRVPTRPGRPRAKATRRRFSAEENLRVLQEADACAPGKVGALLWREGHRGAGVGRGRAPGATDGNLLARNPRRGMAPRSGYRLGAWHQPTSRARWGQQLNSPGLVDRRRRRAAGSWAAVIAATASGPGQAYLWGRGVSSIGAGLNAKPDERPRRHGGLR